MIRTDKKTKVVFSTGNGFLDTSFRPVKPSKSDAIIACANSTSLIKGQIRIDKNSLPSSNIAFSDWLYAKCIEQDIFEANTKYAFVYLCEDTSSEKIFQIYGTDVALQSNQILIPDIFLPMGLDSAMTVSGLFLFDKNLVFYHQNKLVYHALCENSQSILKALEYIRAIYSATPSIIYSQNPNITDLPLQICPLKTLVNNNENPIAALSFLYFSKSKITPLPLLFLNSKTSSFSKSNTFRLLFKTMCAIILMLTYPMGEFFYNLYLKTKFEDLANKNLQILKEISALPQNSHLYAKKAKNSLLQEHLHSLYEAEISYLPRYELIANLTKMLKGKGISVQDLHLSSDILQDGFAMSLEVSSLSQKNIINSINILKNNPLWADKEQQIFSGAITKSQEKSFAQIILVHNVF
ncbi:hypothetical protein BKH41_08025 [Helicobacter sp. 12S02232-10]|uniref:hypothetical protein n=1 Tax=Helicobacter sp. 12S02232-10 TaxID=1476197 RepID=UPI000BA4F20B|nr:hypothetical protein [Helicobacter sp. 12S02232-10]PAF47218.1 hypothetical protein BKH41_08025 [Helicobacter sp. 12S02232-10]